MSLATGLAPGDAAAPRAVWHRGWLDAVRHCASPNASPRRDGSAVVLVLVHSISLPPGEFGGAAIEQLFTNRLDWEAHPYYGTIRGLEVSAHFLVRRDGATTQFVSCDARAWHAGASSWQGRADCNEFSVGIELEGLEGGAFEAAQYDALARLIDALRARYPIEAVVGHEHVAPGRKADPGAGFDWSGLRARLAPVDLAFGDQPRREA